MAARKTPAKVLSTGKAIKAKPALSSRKTVGVKGGGASRGKPVATKSPRPTGNIVCPASMIVARFFELGGSAIDNGTKIFVKNRADQRFMTLDPSPSHLRGPVLDVSPQHFRENFSHYSQLVMIGMCFRLASKSGKKVIYARQHSSYRHPLEQVIQHWQERLADDESARRLETKLVNAINANNMRNSVASDEVLDAIRNLKQGMARLGIGHRPFEAGQIPDEDDGAEMRPV